MVLAKLPDSTKTTALSRFVEAAYVYSKVGGLTYVVSAMVDECPKHCGQSQSILLKIGLESFQDLLKDPSDTLAPSILKKKEDGVPNLIKGELDKAFKGRVSDGPTTEHEQSRTTSCMGERTWRNGELSGVWTKERNWLKAQRQRLETAEPISKVPDTSPGSLRMRR